MSIVFASICPHPPLLLPKIGSIEDKEKVKKTLAGLHGLAEEFKKAKPDSIVISSPHQDWGFNVPLYFLAGDFKGDIRSYLTGFEEPSFYFEEGKKIYKNLDKDKKWAIIASGDLSHCLKEDGPYGFHPDGPKFDKALSEALKAKDIEALLSLNEKFPEAGECGLRSFSFLLGVLDNLKWEPEILSYEGPFGVGYLAANFKISSK
jgi:aromatic ring-opening dioxygenase LigB subunit